MLKPFLLVLFLCIAVCSRGNDIDKLKTLDDVKAFLKHLSKENRKIDFFGGTKKDSTERLSQEKFIKIDLNADGLTDLIVNGTYLFVVIDNGRNHFDGHYIDSGPWAIRKYILTDIDSTQRLPKIVVKNHDKYTFGPPERTIYDTLVFKYNGLVNYTNKPEQNEIREITISTGLCFGTCPEFDLTVSLDGAATFNAKEYLKKKGLFKGIINKAALADLFNLANYIRVRSLEDRYRVNWTDDQTVILSVTFADGSKKIINDYGLIGTFGLNNLYQTLFKIKNFTKWKSLQNPDVFHPHISMLFPRPASVHPLAYLPALYQAQLKWHLLIPIY